MSWARRRETPGVETLPSEKEGRIRHNRMANEPSQLLPQCEIAIAQTTQRPPLCVLVVLLVSFFAREGFPIVADGGPRMHVPGDNFFFRGRNRQATAAEASMMKQL